MKNINIMIEMPPSVQIAVFCGSSTDLAPSFRLRLIKSTNFYHPEHSSNFCFTLNLIRILKHISVLTNLSHRYLSLRNCTVVV